jgi:outer membrane lipoprotein SlyB
VNKVIVLSATLLSTALLSGCMQSNAARTTGNDYRTSEVRQAGEVQYGKLMNVRTVRINENHQDSQMNSTGIGTGGAVLGGVIGNNMGGNNGMLIGGLLGAAAGALASNATVGETDGWEMDIQLSSGQVIVVVQAKAQTDNFVTGMQVRVVRYGNTYRVSALN